MDSPSEDPVQLVVHLLDPVRGYPIQSWTLTKSVISIGRLPTCDVVVTDPHVSRKHAELRHQVGPQEGHWLLVSLSRHGVEVDGRPVEQYVISRSTVFRLGAGGPELQVLGGDEWALDTPTISYQFAQLSPIEIDERRKTAEIAAIADGDAFNGLLEKAKKLRKDLDR